MGMEKSIQSSLPMWVLAIIGCFLLVTQLAMATTDDEFQNQKNYYSPDPHHASPSHGSPSHHHGGGTSPSHGGGTSPSHGGGGGGGGSPPSHSTPSDPSTGNCGTPPSSVPTPSTPPSGGGGYYPNPPSSGGSPPSTPTTPTPSTPYVPTPSTPSSPTTPYVPTPSTPTTPNSPPFVPVDPNSPFSCNYWRNHPGLVWGLVGWWGTVGNAFGVTSLPGFGTTTSTSGTTLQQLLTNTRSDGYGTLYREGTASLLNSMVTHKFPFTTMQVRDRFISGLASNKAATAQGHLFKMANDGKLKL